MGTRHFGYRATRAKDGLTLENVPDANLGEEGSQPWANRLNFDSHSASASTFTAPLGKRERQPNDCRHW